MRHKRPNVNVFREKGPAAAPSFRLIAACEKNEELVRVIRFRLADNFPKLSNAFPSGLLYDGRSVDVASKRKDPDQAPVVSGSEIGVDPETLWLAADKLRGTVDAAEYKHVVLGLIFLKYISDAEAQYTAFPDDVLFAWSESLGVHRWRRAEAIINQHIFKVIPKDNSKWYVYYRLLEAMPFFQIIASAKATKCVMKSPEEQIRPLYDLIHCYERQSFTIAAIRDALLPKLISGEIRLGGDEGAATRAAPTDVLGEADGTRKRGRR